ncbi:MAG: hypothetical protein ACLVHV_03415 [Oscillospiraceae bacterium]
MKEELSNANPLQAQAMIHSLNSKRDVLILSFEDINHCRAVFGNKLGTAVYNPYAGLFYVDDVYGVIEEWDSEN